MSIDRNKSTCAIVAGVLLMAGITACTHAQTVEEQDRAARSEAIHWPQQFTPESAVLFAHNQIHIEASCAQAWSYLVNATQWPQWYSNASNIQIEGGGNQLQAGSAFTWNTFGLQVKSRVQEFVVNERLGWFGNTADLAAYHTWLLVPETKGCHVITEEVVKGTGAVAMKAKHPDGMHKGHELWLTSLKKAVEQTQ